VNRFRLGGQLPLFSTPLSAETATTDRNVNPVLNRNLLKVTTHSSRHFDEAEQTPRTVILGAASAS
jgi:hypothetical protein